VRQELSALETDVALCERCFGPERRSSVRFDRPADRPRILVLVERPPRASLGEGVRFGLHNEDPGTLFLRELLVEAGLSMDIVLLGAAVLCRAGSRSLEAAVPHGVCLRECAPHVRELIRLSEPRLILPLGRAALRSVRLALAGEDGVDGLHFPESVGRSTVVGGRWIHPLYHVTLRARVTRPAEVQRADWREVGRLWRWLREEG
jgi:uracil-DNA glycosylase